MTERIVWLMANPGAKYKEYEQMFGCTERTFRRDRLYIKERLWFYQVSYK